MPERIAGWLFDFQCRKGRLSEEQRKLYVYAYNLLISRAVVYVLLLLAGLLLGNLKEMALFLLAFIPLRQYAGGVHFEGAGNCIAASSILICLSGQYLKYYPEIPLPLFFVWIAAAFIIIVLAPVGCAYKKLVPIEQKVYKRRTRITFCIECAVLMVSYFMDCIWISKGIMLAQAVLAVSIMLGWIKENFFKHGVSKN